MKKLNPLFLFCLTILLWSCQSDSSSFNSQSSSEKEISFPELLDRHEKLWHGKEWDDIQSAYVAARDLIKKGKQPEENYLKLSAIFTNEARITGEHGHYYPAALEVLNRALKNDALEEDIRFRALAMKAGVLLSQHEFSDALFFGNEAFKINPRNAHVLGVLVDAHVEMGNYKEAVKMADRMVSLRPDLRSYARVSYLREIFGDVDGAIEAMQMAVQAGMPGYEQTAWTQLTLGELYERYDQPEKAEKEYNKILANRNDYPFAIAALANLEMQKGNFENAETLLEKACKIIPEVGFYEQLAELYQKTNRTEDFQQIIPEILAMLKDDVDHGHKMNLEYASLYLNMLNDSEKALEFALREYNTRPENIDVNMLLGKIYLEKQDYEQAAAFAARADKTDSQHPDLLQLKTNLQDHLAQN